MDIIKNIKSYLFILLILSLTNCGASSIKKPYYQVPTTRKYLCFSKNIHSDVIRGIKFKLKNSKNKQIQIVKEDDSRCNLTLTYHFAGLPLKMLSVTKKAGYYYKTTYDIQSKTYSQNKYYRKGFYHKSKVYNYMVVIRDQKTNKPIFSFLAQGYETFTKSYAGSPYRSTGSYFSSLGYGIGDKLINGEQFSFPQFGELALKNGEIKASNNEFVAISKNNKSNYSSEKQQKEYAQSIVLFYLYHEVVTPLTWLFNLTLVNKDYTSPDYDQFIFPEYIMRKSNVKIISNCGKNCFNAQATLNMNKVLDYIKNNSSISSDKLKFLLENKNVIFSFLAPYYNNTNYKKVFKNPTYKKYRYGKYRDFLTDYSYRNLQKLTSDYRKIMMRKK